MAEVMGLNPVQVWIFSDFIFAELRKFFKRPNCDSHFFQFSPLFKFKIFNSYK